MQTGEPGIFCWFCRATAGINSVQGQVWALVLIYEILTLLHSRSLCSCEIKSVHSCRMNGVHMLDQEYELVRSICYLLYIKLARVRSTVFKCGFKIVPLCSCEIKSVHLWFQDCTCLQF